MTAVVRHSTQVSLPNNPDRAVSATAWNAVHSVTLATAPRRIRIAAIGDSRLDRYTSSTTPNSPRSDDILAWTQFFCRGAIEFGKVEGLNFAVSGARIAEVVASQLDDAIATDAECVFLYVSTNSTTDYVSASNIMADIDTIVAAVRASGKLLVIFSENPRTGYSDEPRRQQHRTMAEYFRRQRSLSGVIVIDPWTFMVDPTSTESLPLTGVTQDGLHQSTYTAMKLGKLAAAELMKFLPPANLLASSRADLFDASAEPYGSLTANANLDGTTGTEGSGVTGDTADGWTITTADADMTAVVSKTTDANGIPVQRIVVSGTPVTASLPYIRLSKAIGDIAWLSAGDQIELAAGLKIASGHTGLVSPSVVIVPAGSTADRQWSHYVADTYISQIGGEEMDGVCVTQKYTVPSPVPASMSFYLYLLFKKDEAASATVDVYSITPRKV